MCFGFKFKGVRSLIDLRRLAALVSGVAVLVVAVCGFLSVDPCQAMGPAGDAAWSGSMAT